MMCRARSPGLPRFFSLSIIRTPRWGQVAALGTAKLLTLFRPATGEVRGKGVPGAPNVVLHPWLQHEVLQVLAELPDRAAAAEPEPASPAHWATWLQHVPHAPLPPLRLILIWDNLAGHLSTSIVTWLFARGGSAKQAGSWTRSSQTVLASACLGALLIG